MAPDRSPSRTSVFSLLVLLPLLSFFHPGSSDEEIGTSLSTVFNSTDDKRKKHKLRYHFHLSNDELINYYLKKKVLGIDLQRLHNAINEVDILNFEPQDLPAMSAIKSEDSYWYFFYQLEDGRKHERGGGGNNRTLNSGKGKWKVTGKTRILRSDKTNQPIGTKKTLVFERSSDKTMAKDKAKSQTKWTIHEYHLPSDFPNPDKYVIIKLKKKGGKAVASSPEEGKTSYLPEKAKDTATYSIVNDVEFDNQPSIGFEESSLSSCMEPISNYYYPNHNMYIETSTSSCAIPGDSPSCANPGQFQKYYDPNQDENTELGPSCQERSTSSCGVYITPWTNLESIPSYYYINHTVRTEQGPSWPERSVSSCVVDNPSWENLGPIGANIVTKNVGWPGNTNELEELSGRIKRALCIGEVVQTKELVSNSPLSLLPPSGIIQEGNAELCSLLQNLKITKEGYKLIQ